MDLTAATAAAGGEHDPARLSPDLAGVMGPLAV